MTELQAKNNLIALWELKKSNGKNVGKLDNFASKHMVNIKKLCGATWDCQLASAYIASIFDFNH